MKESTGHLRFSLCLSKKERGGQLTWIGAHIILTPKRAKAISKPGIYLFRPQLFVTDCGYGACRLSADLFVKELKVTIINLLSNSTEPGMHYDPLLQIVVTSS